MAVAVTIKTRAVVGDRRRQLAEVTLDNSYPAGGYPLKPSSFGLSVSIHDAQCTPKILSGSEAVPVGGAYFDSVTKKLVVLNAKTQAEFAPGTNLSNVVFFVEAWGR